MGGIDFRNLPIEVSLRYHISDPCTKFEEDWTKIVVAIVDERFVRTDTHMHTHTHRERERESERERDTLK